MTLYTLRHAIARPINHARFRRIQHTSKRLLGLSSMAALALGCISPLPSQAHIKTTQLKTTQLKTTQLTTNSQLGVEISGLRNQDGQVCLSLFASSQGFPGDGDSAIQNQCISASSTPSVTFDNVQPGSYAIAVLHDANGDRTINRNLLGIPSEGFGFSRNPVIRTGPPAFGDAVVFVAGSETNIQIALNYF